MDSYEILYTNLSDTSKNLKDYLTAAQKSEKNIMKKVEKGEFKSVIKEITFFQELLENAIKYSSEFNEIVQNFDSNEFFSNGEFATSLLENCKESNIDTAGEFPVYEMFPYKVKIDSENQEVWLDRKKISSIRPKYISEFIGNSLEKLNKVRFDAETFINELFSAYKSYVVKHNAKEGSVVGILNIYKELVPMTRFRKEYDQQAFAFDIARLYREPDIKTKEGAKVIFSSSRGNQIRILSSDGVELFIGSIAFEIMR